MRYLLLAALLLASCSKSGPPDLKIRDAWARETVAGQTSTAAYMVIANEGSGDDRLTGVSADAPAMAMLHSSESSGGVARMRSMTSGLAIPAGTTIALKPGGSHVMVMGLKAPLQRGQKIKLTLQFEKSGARPIDVAIVSATEPR